MKMFPAPDNFAEGQRALALWLMSAAGMFAGLMIMVIIAMLVWGNWSLEQQHTILLIIGGLAGGFSLSMIAVILALAVGGPVGKFHVDASRQGVMLDLDDKPDAPGAPKPTITTTTEIKPS